jgi:hypothetical protein
VSEKKSVDWTLRASSGMVGSDIDYAFFDSLSQVELVNFGITLKNVVAMYENEMKSRGL